MNILSIGYGRNIFNQNNPERKRLERCAQEVSSLHMVIFTLKKDGLSSVVNPKGLSLYPTNSSSKFHMIFDAIRIGKALLSEAVGPWVVTAQDPFEAGLVGWRISRSKGLPFNVQMHGEDSFSLFHRNKRNIIHTIRKVIGRFIIMKAHTVRVVSDRTATTMNELGIPATHIMKLPVRTDVVRQDLPASEHDLHVEYPHASTIVLSLGRLTGVKNLPLLIDSFANLYAKDPNALLLIVGNGPEETALKARVRALGLQQNVIFIPWTDDPFTLMHSADIFALSSNWEGWARVLIEAMYAGTPVVTTDVGCAGEVLRNGQHGFVVPVGDATAFSERLIELAGDPQLRERFGRTAQEDVKAVHVSLDAYALAWAEVFDRTYEIFMQKNTDEVGVG